MNKCGNSTDENILVMSYNEQQKWAKSDTVGLLPFDQHSKINMSNTKLSIQFV